LVSRKIRGAINFQPTGDFAVKKLLAGASAIALSLTPLAALAQAPGFTLPNNSVYQGHFNSAPAGLPPSTSNCTIAAGSTDTDGSCTSTSGAPVVTFAVAWNKAPWCLVQDSSATPAVVYTLSTTAITITGTTAHVYYWHCAGQTGG
jgi:hypothetical protein